MKNEKNITEQVSTVNRILTPPPPPSPSRPIYIHTFLLFIHLFIISSRFDAGGGGDRDEGLNKFRQDDSIIFPKKLECKVNKLFKRSWRSL